jgi:hypothetical protein
LGEEASNTVYVDNSRYTNTSVTEMSLPEKLLYFLNNFNLLALSLFYKERYVHVHVSIGSFEITRFS